MIRRPHLVLLLGEGRGGIVPRLTYRDGVHGPRDVRHYAIERGTYPIVFWRAGRICVELVDDLGCLVLGGVEVRGVSTFGIQRWIYQNGFV